VICEKIEGATARTRVLSDQRPILPLVEKRARFLA